MSTSLPIIRSSTAKLAVPLVSLILLSQLWFNLLSGTVKDPYLDEVFHVRQAQAYCYRSFAIWDPKITTPPGLYLISYLLHVLGVSCDIAALRRTCSTLLSVGVFYLVFRIRQVIDARALRPSASTLTAFNICIFPILFFFGALYYTDVASTFSVLLHHLYFLRSGPEPLSLTGISLNIALGLASLWFRQTNVFWVSIFPAGLALISMLKSRNTGTLKSKSSASQYLPWLEIVRDSWHAGRLYDPQVSEASLEDYLKVIASLGIASLRNWDTLVVALIPYICSLFGFAAFVFWNGGVVLGDKSNHIATIHLPQMLYIWPYIAFFSWPLLHPHILSIVLPSKLQQTVFSTIGVSNVRKLPHLLPIFLFMGVVAAAVHYNTIIHPFTLADNRHYVFYVFRILRLHPAIKYTVVPVYVICAWAAIQSLGSLTIIHKDKTEPSTHSSLAKGGSVGFVIIWLITCALSLIGAPLVEPRYFIMPWMMWRLYVPVSGLQTPVVAQNRETKGGKERAERVSQSWLRKVLVQFDHRLWLETGWFLIVNVLTGYMFLSRGFEWPQEPGKVQRFMW